MNLLRKGFAGALWGEASIFFLESLSIGKDESHKNLKSLSASFLTSLKSPVVPEACEYLELPYL